MTESKVQVVDQYEDEISLRDLYLIIKGGFWWILGISLLSALATFILFTLRPDVYEAQSTTVITPSSISIENDVGVSFTPQTNVSFQAYRTLATSQSVLEAVVFAAYEAGYTEDDISLKSLTDDSNVKQLFGPPVNRPESASSIPLSINHIVKHSNPDIAAFLANDWAEESLETVKIALLNALNPVGNVTNNQLNTRQKAMDSAEEALREFNISSNLVLIEKRFLDLTDKVSESESNLIETKNTISILEAENQFLDNLLVEAESNFEQALEQLNSFDSQEGLVSFEAEMEIYQTEFSELPFSIRDVEGDIEKIKLEIVLLQQQLDTMQRGNAQKQPLIIGDNDNISQIHGMISQLNDNIGPLTSDVLGEYMLSQIKDDLREKNISLEGLVEKYNFLVSNYNIAVEKLPNLKAKVVTLQSERSKLLEYLNLMEGRKSAILMKLNQVSDEELDSRENQSLFKLNQLRIELDVLTEQLQNDRSKLLNLQEERAELLRESERLGLGVENARAAYQEVIRLEPTISYISDLLPSSAQVLNAASVPVNPIETNRIIASILAFLLVGVLITLWFFLRTAIRNPLIAGI